MSADTASLGETAARAVDEAECAAFLAADISTLRRLWHPDLIVNAPHNRLMTVPPTLAAIEAGRLRHAELTRTIETIAMRGDVAVIMGDERVFDDQGPLAGREVHRRFTNVWERQPDDAWRLIARHASVVSAKPRA